MTKYIRINEAGMNKRMGKNLNKHFRWNGVFLSIQSRSLFPYQKHLINKTLKFSVNCKLLVKIGRSLIVFIL